MKATERGTCHGAPLHFFSFLSSPFLTIHTSINVSNQFRFSSSVDPLLFLLLSPPLSFSPYLSFSLSSFLLSPSLILSSDSSLFPNHLFLPHCSSPYPLLLSLFRTSPLLSLLLSSLLTSPHFTVTCCHKSTQAVPLGARANENRQGNRLIY